MATLLHDTFTGAAGLLSGHTADSGATYTKHPRASAQTLRLDGTGGLRNSGSGGPTAYVVSTVPATAEQWGTTVYKRLSATNFQGAGVVLRASATLLTGYFCKYNVSTGRAEVYRFGDDGTTITPNLLATIPVTPIAVGGSATLEAHVWDPDANRVRIQLTWGGSPLTPYDDTDPERITAAGRILIGQIGSGGTDTDGLHVDEALVLDAAAGSPPAAPTDVVAAMVNATSATLSSVDASTNETGWHDVWAPDDGTGQADEANINDLGTFPSTTVAATGGTVSRTVTGLPDNTRGIFLGRRAMGIGGESATTWAAQSIDTPPLPRILSIDSPHGTDQITPGTRVVLAGTYENAAGPGDWYRGDPDDGGTLLGTDPYLYDTTGRPEGDEELVLLIANATGDTDKASVLLPLGASAPATGRLILGGTMRYVSVGETAPGPRRVEVLVLNADGTPATDQAGVTPLLVVDGQPTDAAANALEAKNAASGRYYHTYDTSEVSTANQLLEIQIDGLDVYRSEALVTHGVGVNEDGEAAASLSDLVQAAVAEAVASRFGVTSSVSDAAPTASSFKGAAGLSATDDFYKGMYWLFTGGALDGISQKVTGYDGTTRAFSFAPAFPSAPANGDAGLLIGRG